MSLLPATVDDLDEIVAIENVSFRNPFTRNLFEMELRLDIAHLWVVKRSGRVAGYLDFWQIGPEMHLINIAVHPEWRRQGIARSLLEFMIDFASQHRVKEIVLDVRVSNEGAISLYKKYSFRPIAVRKKYYQDNDEDALVMKCLT